jgi:prepilin peptidase CpaA
MLSPPIVELFILTAMLVVAAAYDLRSHRIPNLLTYPAMLIGLGLASVSAGLSGLLNHTLGLLAAGVPMFVLFAGGSLGGGDVKLMAAVGALLGLPMALNALLASIMVGGLCAALILIWQGRLLGMATHSWRSLCHRSGLRAEPPAPLPRHRDSFPFGVAIAIGTLSVTITPDMLAAS